MINDFILSVAIILLTGLIFGKLSKIVKVPDITGYIVGGLLIGPFLISKIIPAFAGVLGADSIEVLSLVVDIELAFIAFAVGAEFKISYFKRVGPMPIIIAFAESFAAVVFITVGLLIFQVPLYFALALGAVGGATAPAATIMVIKQYKAKGELAQTLLSVTAIDDASALLFFGIAIAIVKMIIFQGNADLGLTLIMPIVEIIGSIVLGAIIGFILTFAMRLFRSRGNRLIIIIIALFLNIGLSIFFKNQYEVSLSSLMCCIVTGAVFTNTSENVDEALPLIDGITPPLVIMFFILAGAGLRLEAMSLVAIICTVIYLLFRVAGKVIGTRISARATKAPEKVKKWLGYGLLPQGGIAIGLSAIVMELLNDPTANVSSGWFGGFNNIVFNGDLLRVIVLCAVFASELFGPLLSKMAILKSGEGIDPNKKKIVTQINNEKQELVVEQINSEENKKEIVDSNN